MIRAGTAELITEAPQAHGVLDTPEETTRKVYCTEKSVGQTEVYQARATGLNPELKLILKHAFDYHGETQLIYRGERYHILRTYRTESDSIELTIQRVCGNAAAEVPEETAQGEPAETGGTSESEPAPEPSDPDGTGEEGP